jgi:hypothetical protein
MADFGGGYFPIENDLGQNGKLEANHREPKEREISDLGWT